MSLNLLPRRLAGWGLTGLAAALLAGLLLAGEPPRAQAEPQPAPPAAPHAVSPAQPGVSNDYCLECHGLPDRFQELPSGELQYLTIDRFGYAVSVHGRGGYACVQCHTTIREYPHPPSTAQDLRDVALQNYTTCRECHVGQYELTQDSVHQSELTNGNREAAICTDCHNPHYQNRLTNPETGELWANARLSIPQTCARCHSAIYDQYKLSVHGAALLGDEQNAGGNPDVPTCIDCHGVHNVPDPRTTGFRLDSPQVCAKCHTDPVRMEPYGLSTAVLDTYVADFHGSTVTLFERLEPDQETNKPVCFDCHGIHDILSVKDPQKGLSVRENMLVSCQRCHPDATVDFAESWLSHYIPSPDRNPLVYWVDVFYQFFIPGVIGGMAVFVVADFGRRLYERLKGGRHQ